MDDLDPGGLHRALAVGAGDEEDGAFAVAYGIDCGLNAAEIAAEKIHEMLDARMVLQH